MKYYLDGKEMQPGWEWKTTLISVLSEQPFYFYPACPDREYIETFKADIPVKQIYRGWNSIHFITECK